MNRWFLGVALVLILTGWQVEGGDKKPPPKQNATLTFVDPSKAGPDYLVQGEYKGKITIKDTIEDIAPQVVAHGAGKFAVVVYPGGLPGAGWDGAYKDTAEAVSENGKVAVKGRDFNGKIIDGKFTGGRGTSEFEMRRIERKSPTLGKMAPYQAVVLFDGKNVNDWERGILVENAYLSPLAKGNIVSKKKFKDFKLHLEFRTPFMPFRRGQQRGNSGVYLQDRYELQVLDSFGLKGENNECGGFYQQARRR